MITAPYISVKPNVSSFTIELMAVGDWAAIRGIYLEGIATGLATFETEAPSWDRWDAAHLSFGRLVARRGGDVLGWAALSPVSQRKVYAGVAEVSVYVAESSRRKVSGGRCSNN